METPNFLMTGLTLISLLSINAFSAEVDFSSNPFLEENKHVQGPQVFSFSKQPERVPDIFPGSNYVELAKQTQVNGFALVEPDKVIDLTTWIEGFTQYTETFSKKLKPLLLAEQSDYDQSHLVNKFAADIDNLESVIDKEFTVKSKHLGGNFIAGKGWDQLTYIVSHPDYEVVVIEVQAFDESSGAVMDADAINYRVKGSPAVLYVLQDKAGNESTQLSWLTPQASYNIQLEKNVNTVALQSKFNTLVEIITPDD